MSSTSVNLQVSTFGVKKKMKKKSVVVASSRNPGDRVPLGGRRSGGESEG